MDVDEDEEVVHQVQAGEDHTALCLELVSCMTKILDPLCPQAERAACNQVLILIIAHYQWESTSKFVNVHCS